MAMHPAPVAVVPERLRTASRYNDWSGDEWDSDRDCQQGRLGRVDTVTEYSEWSFAEWSPAEWDIPTMHAPRPRVPCPAAARSASEAVQEPAAGTQLMLTELLHADQAGGLRLDPPTMLDAAAPAAASPAAAESAVASKVHRGALPGAVSPDHQGPHWYTELHRRRGGRAGHVSGAERSEAAAADLSDSQRLLQLLQGSADDCSLALAALRGRVWELSREKLGCRVVQAALDVAPLAQAARLVRELHGHVGEAVASPHANFVIQRAIEKLPATESAFIAQELVADAKEVAYHRFGCRIIIRLVEHAATDPSTAAVLEKILEDCVGLSCHRFGRHVVLSILEQLEAYRPRVVARIQHSARSMAKHRDGSYLVEAALRLCSTEDQDTLARALVGGGRDAVLDLASDAFACFVVRALANMSSTSTQQHLSRQVVGDVFYAQAEVKESGPGGARLVRDLKPRFEAMARAPW